MAKLKTLARAPRCAAKFKSGGKCLERVANVGDMCPRHARTPARTITGRFSAIKRQSIRERIADIQKFERDAMDLLPEIELTRALLINFVEEYDEFVEALTAWNNTLDPRQRPVAIPKLEDVTKLLDTVGKLVARQNEIRNRSSISIEDFHRALSAMGMAVAAFVSDPNILKQIELAWGNISLDSRHPLTSHQRQLNSARVIDVTPKGDDGFTDAS
jgi:hypothetical protein